MTPNDTALLLEELKTVFAGEALPHWQTDINTTYMRGQWLDKLDTALDLLNRPTPDIERVATSNIPTSVLSLVRFLCSLYGDVNEWAYKHCDGEALAHYPVVQGTNNQIKLTKIGKQLFTADEIRVAVDWMLNESTAMQPVTGKSQGEQAKDDVIAKLDIWREMAGGTEAESDALDNLLEARNTLEQLQPHPSNSGEKG